MVGAGASTLVHFKMICYLFFLDICFHIHEYIMTILVATVNVVCIYFAYTVTKLGIRFFAEK